MTAAASSADEVIARIPAGAHVVVGQGTAEPLALSRALVRRRHDIGGVSVFLGALFSDTFAPEATDGMSFCGYGAIGAAGRLANAGRLDILAVPYSRLPERFGPDRPADAVLLQLARSPRGLSFGLAHDYTAVAARHARLVIAEVNAQAPWTHGAEVGPEVRIDHLIETGEPPCELPPARVSETEERIGRQVAALVDDGATIQTGIGALPDAILAALKGHRDLGIHSGMIGDRAVDLIEAGVVTNARKRIDPGTTVAGVLFGTARLNRFADRNQAVRLVEPARSHGAASLSRVERFTAINSAVEVDLTGQVNAEVVQGRYAGAVGGQPDFVRAALGSPGGRSIIALPSTAASGTVSRIVARLSGPVTSPRCDADMVVTEWGVAALRGLTLAERCKAMLAIADPKFRDRLERDAALAPLA
ncbi:MAG: 4-hydroxybutyrate CoA-transferase [Alphaproteobacteria bacterium]|nr:4-hydroxybutyrate CoA-transferase [Alphaproteobacteria bacterium]